MKIWHQWFSRQNFRLLDPISQTDAEVQGNLLRDFELKFSELPEQEEVDETLLQCWFLEEH